MRQTYRKLAEYGLLLLLFVIPLSGLFRIDLAKGIFLAGGYEIWWSDFFIVLPFWFLLILTMLMLYTVFGMVFCGWLCPQNTLSEFSTKVIQRFLGKRAKIGFDSIDQENLRIKKEKMKNPLNWIIIGLIFFVVSAVFAFFPLPFFFPFHDIVKIFSGEGDAHVLSTYWIGVGVIFLDIAFIRHFWCKYLCVYAVWQYFFHSKGTMHLKFDKKREEECAQCTLCRCACFLGIDPRKTDTYSHCINCGECIDACEEIKARSGEQSLLSFRIGGGENGKINNGSGRKEDIWKSLRFPFVLFVFAGSCFLYGLWNYHPFHVSLVQDRNDISHSLAQEQTFRIMVANKSNKEHLYRFRIEGIEGAEYRKLPSWASLPVQKGDTLLRLKAGERKEAEFILNDRKEGKKHQLRKMTLRVVETESGETLTSSTTTF